MNFKILILFAGFFLFSFLNTIAQNTNDTIYIDEITVKEAKHINKTGLTYTKIDSIKLKNNIENDLASILSSSPIFIKNYGNGSISTASFRGTAASHTQVEWNGININSPMLGQVDFSLIPVFFTDKIELFHGNSSLSHTSGGLGGSVILQNIPDWTNKFNLTAIQEFASFDTYSSFLKIGFGNKKIQSVTRFFYKTSQNDFNALPEERHRRFKTTKCRL